MVTSRDRCRIPAAGRRRPCRPGDLRQGLLRQVVTRVYFADEPAANAADPVLAALAAPARATLLADPVAGGYHLDIHLQGEHATTFFAV